MSVAEKPLVTRVMRMNTLGRGPAEPARRTLAELFRVDAPRDVEGGCHLVLLDGQGRCMAHGPDCPAVEMARRESGRIGGGS